MQAAIKSKTNNLFDKDAVNTDNGYVESAYLTTDGTVASHPWFFISEYIEVKSNVVYFWDINGGSGGTDHSVQSVCFYDSAKTFISGERYFGSYGKSFTTPNNTKYLRLTGFAGKETTEMLNEGSTALPYEPYGYKLVPVTPARVHKSKNLLDETTVSDDGQYSTVWNNPEAGSMYVRPYNRWANFYISPDGLRKIFSTAGDYTFQFKIDAGDFFTNDGHCMLTIENKRINFTSITIVNVNTNKYYLAHINLSQEDINAVKSTQTNGFMQLYVSDSTPPERFSQLMFMQGNITYPVEHELYSNKIVPLFGTMPAEIKWVEPIKTNNNLRFVSIYKATKDGNNLEVI